VQAAPFDLASVVREAAAATRAGLGPDSPLSVDVRAPAELVVPGDPYRLRQVVDNLLGNAVKYSPDGGRITVTLARTGAVATLSVADTGMGIAPAEREKMFSRLYRATEVREKAIPGTGLGLALSRAVVERHHGTITLEPHDGPGTTVTLRLPLHPR
jgi:signal transduction histidine kinase